MTSLPPWWPWITQLSRSLFAHQTHPSIVVEEGEGCDDGQEDEGGPHGLPRGALRPVHHVVPPVQRGVPAERPERLSLAEPLSL